MRQVLGMDLPARKMPLHISSLQSMKSIPLDRPACSESVSRCLAKNPSPFVGLQAPKICHESLADVKKKYKLEIVFLASCDFPDRSRPRISRAASPSLLPPRPSRRRRLPSVAVPRKPSGTRRVRKSRRRRRSKRPMVWLLPR